MGFWSKVESDIESLAAKVRALDGTVVMADAETYLAGLVADLETRLKGSPIADLVLAQVASQLGVPASPKTAANPSPPTVVTQTSANPTTSTK